MLIKTLLPLLLTLAIGLGSLRADDSWPQFRGSNGTARSQSRQKLPAELGPETNVVWKTALPPGHSSPVVFGERIYLTAVDDDRLYTIGIDRTTGEVLWRAEAPYNKLEQVHGIGSFAQPTPVTDGERIVSFFGSAGLFCYDRQGALLWQRKLGPFNNDFGAATSPILVEDSVILCQDHDTDSFLMKLDKRTGKVIWKTDRSEFPRNYCTPVVVNVDGARQIVVAATLRVVGYDFETGKEVWTVRGIARAACSSPAVSEDGLLYFATYAGGGDPGDRISIPPYDETAKLRDQDGSGTLEQQELPDGDPIGRRFSQVDRDNSNTVTRAEYDYFRELFDKSRNVVIAVRPGGQGDVTERRVVWEFTRYVPFIASPVAANGLLFTVKDGGILTSLDAQTGEDYRTARLSASGAYYSSPVAGDGKLYLLNQSGQLSVVSAEREWKVLATADFDEAAYATPALVDGRIYLRTAGHLYCFGKP